MTVTKSRGATRRLGPISTGSKIVCFDIPNLTRCFTVHEDVICRSSTVFKTRFQLQRKDITSSCSTCFNDLDPAMEEVVFCDKCGQNFHDACIRRWLAVQLGASQPITCPMCRGEWTRRSREDMERFSIQQQLDGQAVQVYLDWLYSGTVHIDTSVSRTNDDFNVVLLQCWEVSNAMEDEAFYDAMIEEFFNEAEAHFWAKSIDYAFVKGKGSDAMRDFVMDIFLTRVSHDWFKTEGRKWPEAFVQKLADRCLEKARSGEKIKSYEEINAMYVKCHGEEEKDEMVRLVSVNEGGLESLPLSASSFVHGRTSLHQLEEGESSGRNTDRKDVPSGRPAPLADLPRRHFSNSSATAAGRRGLHDGGVRRASAVCVLIPARTVRPAQAEFATLHGAPVRLRSLESMPRFGSARR